LLVWLLSQSFFPRWIFRSSGRFHSNWLIELLGRRWGVFKQSAHVIVMIPFGTPPSYLETFLTEMCRDDHGNGRFDICLLFQKELGFSSRPIIACFLN
jgi:hypothetical protein